MESVSFRDDMQPLAKNLRLRNHWEEEKLQRQFLYNENITTDVHRQPKLVITDEKKVVDDLIL